MEYTKIIQELMDNKFFKKNIYIPVIVIKKLKDYKNYKQSYVLPYLFLYQIFS